MQPGDPLFTWKAGFEGATPAPSPSGKPTGSSISTQICATGVKYITASHPNAADAVPRSISALPWRPLTRAASGLPQAVTTALCLRPMPRSLPCRSRSFSKSCEPRRVNGPYFPNKSGEAFSSASVHDPRFRADCGFKDWVLHDLQRTMATR